MIAYRRARGIAEESAKRWTVCCLGALGYTSVLVFPDRSLEGRHSPSKASYLQHRAWEAVQLPQCPKSYAPNVGSDKTDERLAEATVGLEEQR